VPHFWILRAVAALDKGGQSSSRAEGTEVEVLGLQRSERHFVDRFRRSRKTRRPVDQLMATEKWNN